MHACGIAKAAFLLASAQSGNEVSSALWWLRYGAAA